MTQFYDLRFHESSNSADDGTNGWPNRRNTKIHIESNEEYDSGSSQHVEDLKAVGRWIASMWTYNCGLLIVKAIDCINEFFRWRERREVLPTMLMHGGDSFSKPSHYMHNMQSNVQSSNLLWEGGTWQQLQGHGGCVSKRQGVAGKGNSLRPLWIGAVHKG